MKKEIISDERVVIAKLKIERDAYRFLVWYILIAVLVQQFIMRAPVSQYIVEFIGIIICGYYQTYRHIKEGYGVYAKRSETTKNIIYRAVIFGAFMSVTIIIISGQYGKEGWILSLLAAFVSATITMLAMRFGLQFLSNKRIKKLDAELDIED